MTGRIRHPGFARKVVDADEAAALIKPGANVGMSGFTGAGYPKAVPSALARRIAAAREAGDPAAIGLWTGASTAPELDGELAACDGVDLRLPYQSDPTGRSKINSGAMRYTDMHLSHVAPQVWEGVLGQLDVAVVEVSAITERGELVPSTSVGNNKTWIDQADQVIVEVNEQQSEHLEGMHDVYYGTALPPNRVPIPLTAPTDRIGSPYLHCPADKVVAVVPTNAPDRNTAFRAPDATSEAIAGHVLDFLDAEVRAGRLPRELLPLQSGVGNVANAVLAGLGTSRFTDLTAYTEVIQDGMLDLLDDGTLRAVSATSFSLSSEAVARFHRRAADYQDRIVLRPQEISNHPEVIRRLGCLAMNGAVEADVYGNVNSTHLMGSAVQNGIGGSGDFARNSYLSMFVTPSVAKGGSISTIVPMVSHVDHTEHDVSVIATERGLADLRGLSPGQRADRVIEQCAHPDYRPALRDYRGRALRGSFGGHTPHLLGEALSWHDQYVREGSMLAS